MEPEIGIPPGIEAVHVGAALVLGGEKVADAQAESQLRGLTAVGVGGNPASPAGSSYSLRNALSTTPSIDTIQEFKIESNNAKAENEGAAAVSIITKSGSNQFHGTLFEFNRNSMFGATEFFANAAGLERPPYNRNEFGASGGGPVIRNKAFFFASYEGLRERTQRTRSFAYPTAEMREGNFSRFTATIRDGLTGTPLTGNIIPANRLDPRVLTIQKYLPLPNTPVARADGTGINYTGIVPTKVDINRYSARLDHNFSAKDTLKVSLSYSKGQPYFVSNSGPAAFGNYSDAGFITKSGGLSFTRILGARATNDVRLSYFSHGSIRLGQNTDFDPRTIFPDLYGPSPVGGLPTMSITGFSSVLDLGGADRTPLESFSSVR